MENLFKDETTKDEETPPVVRYMRPEDSIIKELGIQISGKD